MQITQSFLSTPGPMEAGQWDNFEEPTRSPSQIEISCDKYPFKAFVGKNATLLQLERLLGIGCSQGGCVLVTGCRGAGKTTLVNRAIYEAGLLGRFKVKGKDKSDTLPFQSLHENLTENSKITLLARKDREAPPTLVMEVRINVSCSISADSLIRRLVRSFYWSLVGSGIAGLVPDLIASARLACIRTVGTIDNSFEEWLKKAEQETASVKVTSHKGLEVQVGAAAQAEIQLARKMAMHLGVCNKEELEEELLRLFDGLQGAHINLKPSMWQRVGRVATWTKSVWDSVGESIVGGAGLRVSLAVVFDEMDKLDLGIKPGNNTTHSNGTDIQNNEHSESKAIELGPQTLSALADLRQTLNSSDDMLDSAHSIVRELKPILTSGQATFIFVGGTKTAQRWRSERGRRDALLPSIFTDHVHVGLLNEDDAKALLEANVYGWDDDSKWETHNQTHIENIQHIKDYLIFGMLFRSSGILKEFLIELRSLATLHEKAQGQLNTEVMLSLVNDKNFREKAKLGFAIEYALTKYKPEENLEPIFNREIFKKNLSLFDDLKRCYYEVAHNYLTEDDFIEEIELLVGTDKSRHLVESIVSAIFSLLDSSPPDDDSLEVYKDIREAIKLHLES